MDGERRGAGQGVSWGASNVYERQVQRGGRWSSVERVLVWWLLEPAVRAETAVEGQAAVSGKYSGAGGGPALNVCPYGGFSNLLSVRKQQPGTKQ